MTDPADQTESLAPHAPRLVAAGASRAAAPSVVLDRRYALLRRIASGGMASVWEGHDEVLDRTVAVKLLHDHLAADEGFRERFRREAIAAAKLTHPYVVNLYDTGTDGERVYLVMEFVDGVTLKDVMTDLGMLPPGQAASIGERIARALDYAHERGLIHRDVKPANILIGDDGCVKVADFGIAKAEDSADLTKTGMVLGTAAYVAPEQITGADQVDGRADQYALGCMLYEALTGQQAFKGDSPVATAAKRLDADPPPLRSIRPDIPAGLEAIVLRSLERQPADRFPTAGAMADALAPFADVDTGQTAALSVAVSNVTQRVHRRTEPARPARPARGGRMVLALAALLLIGAGVGVAVAFGLFEQTAPTAPTQAEETPAATAVGPLSGALTTLDPQGDDGEENPEMLAALTDGDAETTWRTDIYRSTDFGGIKDGVGVVYRFDAPATVTSLRIANTTPGVNLEIYIADEPASDLAGWTRVATAQGAGERINLPIKPVEAGAVLVWIVSPLPDERRAEFSELTVLGSSS